jgi:glycyl-tRNA synthetase
MMFKTFVGANEDSSNTAYLRPETAGGIFTNFEQVLQTTRAKLPFGIAQIGKAFRNEISPRDFLFRVREFEQMEIEYFVYPKDAEEELKNWKQFAWDWLLEIGLLESNLSWHQHEEDERAHYAEDSWDINYAYPFGSKELWGIANRTDFDLKAHSQASGKELNYFDGEDHVTPYVIEPSLGIDRLFLALIHSAFAEEEVKGEKRVVLKLEPRIAPVDVAVLPLSKNDKLNPLAQKVYNNLVQQTNLLIEYDETQSIGKRYRRQDEIGTPKCVTIDFESLEDGAVTIRDRDTMEQKRVEIDKLKEELNG